MRGRVGAMNEGRRQRLATAARILGGGGSPGRLRRAGMLAVAGALLAGGGGGIALHRQAAALDEARRSTGHLVAVQAVRTSLAQADADVTNAFLSGGLEPRPLRRQYADATARASTELVRAARSDPGRGTEYAEADVALGRYAELMEAARTTNRQGLPVGSNYLRMGSRLLRQQVLPPLARAADADDATATSAFGAAGTAGAWFVACSLTGLALLAVAQARLARLTRRVVSVPAALSGGVLLALAVAAGVLCAVAAHSTRQLERGAAADTAALAQARVAAFDAKTLESLTLVGRGSTPENETSWGVAMRLARTRASAVHDAVLLPPLDAYAREHAAISALDTGGQWAQGVRRAISTAPGSANAGFAAFDTASQARLDRAADDVAAGLASARRPLRPAAALLAAGGLLAAAGSGAGVSRRLGDYR